MNSVVTSDLGTTLYHLHEKIMSLAQRVNLFKYDPSVCDDIEPWDGSPIFRNEALFYLANVSTPDTVEELCSVFEDPVSCQKSLRKYCVEVNGRCNEGIALALAGKSKVGY